MAGLIYLIVVKCFDSEFLFLPLHYYDVFITATTAVYSILLFFVWCPFSCVWDSSIDVFNYNNDFAMLLISDVIYKFLYFSTISITYTHCLYRCLFVHIILLFRLQQDSVFSVFHFIWLENASFRFVLIHAQTNNTRSFLNIQIQGGRPTQESHAHSIAHKTIRLCFIFRGERERAR